MVQLLVDIWGQMESPVAVSVQLLVDICASVYCQSEQRICCLRHFFMLVGVSKLTTHKTEYVYIYRGIIIIVGQYYYDGTLEH